MLSLGSLICGAPNFPGGEIEALGVRCGLARVAAAFARTDCCPHSPKETAREGTVPGAAASGCADDRVGLGRILRLSFWGRLERCQVEVGPEHGRFASQKRKRVAHRPWRTPVTHRQHGVSFGQPVALVHGFRKSDGVLECLCRLEENWFWLYNGNAGIAAKAQEAGT